MACFYNFLFQSFFKQLQFYGGNSDTPVCHYFDCSFPASILLPFPFHTDISNSREKKYLFLSNYIEQCFSIFDRFRNWWGMNSNSSFSAMQKWCEMGNLRIHFSKFSCYVFSKMFPRSFILWSNFWYYT